MGITLIRNVYIPENMSRISAPYIQLAELLDAAVDASRWLCDVDNITLCNKRIIPEVKIICSVHKIHHANSKQIHTIKLLKYYINLNHKI